MRQVGILAARDGGKHPSGGDAHGRGDFAFLHAEHAARHFRLRADALDRLVRSNQPGLDDREAALLGDLVEVGDRLGGGFERLGNALGFGLRLLPLQLILEFGVDLGERPGLVGLVVDDLDDVEAERRLHQVADLAGLHAKGRLLEFSHHATATEVVEVAAILVVGVVV